MIHVNTMGGTLHPCPRPLVGNKGGVFHPLCPKTQAEFRRSRKLSPNIGTGTSLRLMIPAIAACLNESYALAKLNWAR